MHCVASAAAASVALLSPSLSALAQVSLASSSPLSTCPKFDDQCRSAMEREGKRRRGTIEEALKK